MPNAAASTAASSKNARADSVREPKVRPPVHRVIANGHFFSHRRPLWFDAFLQHKIGWVTRVGLPREVTPREDIAYTG